jgi:hypothetical protein
MIKYLENTHEDLSSQSNIAVIIRDNPNKAQIDNHNDRNIDRCYEKQQKIPTAFRLRG